MAPFPYSRYEINLVTTEILRELGVPADMKGYLYIKEAIIHCVTDSSAMYAVTTRLYPEIARLAGTEVSSIEHAIRRTIAVFWNRQAVKNPNISEWFGTFKRPTNSEFIAVVTEKVKIELRKYR